MKTKLMAIAALLTFGFASAQQQEIEHELHTAKGVQFKEGDMFAEGQLSIRTGSDANTFGFSPKFGYFLNDKLAVGADLNFANTKTKPDYNKTTVYGVGAFARYYFLELDHKRFKAYGEAGLGYGHNRYEAGSIDATTNSIKANASVGLNYFITKNIAATFTLANILSYNNSKPESGASVNTFELNLNVFQNIFSQPTFGLLYKF